MEKNRKFKVITIVGLIVALVGMSIGFAVFSDVLTISSSATVTPNEDDFNIKIYGLIANDNADMFDKANYINETSTTALIRGTPSYQNTATINNDNLTISNINVPFANPGEFAEYIVMIKNEGYYDAYFDLAQLKSTTPYSCIAETGTTESLVNAACNYINMYTVIFTMDYLEQLKKYNSQEIGYDELEKAMETDLYTPGKTGKYKLSVGESLILDINFSYASNGERADGKFTALFEDMTLEFKSNI